MMPVCPLCAQSIDSDDAAFQHHVNACLDGQGRSGDDAANQVCPICQLSWLSMGLSIAQREDHLTACLEANASHDRLVGSTTHDCPICGAEMELEEDLRAHAAACFLQRQSDFSWNESGQKSCAKADDAGCSKPASRITASADESSVIDLKSIASTSKSNSPPSGSADLFPIIAALLEHAHEVGYSTSSVLCSPLTLHINVEWGVDWGWGCGYRCFQMLYSAMRVLPQFARRLPNASADASLTPIPSLFQFQEILESAWSQSYDPLGAEHFGGRLTGRRKWVGTTELYTAFTFLGVPVQILDFPEASGANGMHTSLIKWVREYFRSRQACDGDAFATMMKTRGEACIQSTKQPLFLQHQGHSRVIVGIEEGRTDPSLLVFDPSLKDKAALIKAAKEYASTTSEPGASDAESSYSRTGADQGPPFESDSEDEAPKSDKHVCKKQNLERPVKAAASIAKWLGTHKAFSLSDHANLLGVYRLSLRKLSKNDQYQILYVLDDAPFMSTDKRTQKKIPSSIRL